MKIILQNKQRKYEIGADVRNLINSVVIKALELEQIEIQFEISIILTNNRNIRRINNQYRNLDKPTDVLSFPMFEKDELRNPPINKSDITEDLLLGDIVVSVERAYEQSQEFGHSFKREIGYLVVHGMLHLLGYDHMEEKDKELMRSKEEEILKQIELSRD